MCATVSIQNSLAVWQRRPQETSSCRASATASATDDAQEFKGRHQELVSALVERVDPKTGALSLKIGKAEAILPKGEQVGTENVKEGDHVQVYVVDVKETEKGPKAIISRTHPDLIRRLFEKEVPEIFDGTVEIKAVAREAGSRTKIAVMSHNPT